MLHYSLHRVLRLTKLVLFVFYFVLEVLKIWRLLILLLYWCKVNVWFVLLLKIFYHFFKFNYFHVQLFSRYLLVSTTLALVAIRQMASHKFVTIGGNLNSAVFFASITNIVVAVEPFQLINEFNSQLLERGYLSWMRNWH